MPPLSTDLIAAADRYVDEHHEEFSALGKSFFEHFRTDKTQVRNLQQIACSVTRFADIEDFVKNQVGKEKGDGKWKMVGREVLAQLSVLRSDSDGLDSDPANRMVLRLRLARGWARAVVSEYLYRLAEKEMSP